MCYYCLSMLRIFDGSSTHSSLFFAVGTIFIPPFKTARCTSHTFIFNYIFRCVSIIHQTTGLTWLQAPYPTLTRHSKQSNWTMWFFVTRSHFPSCAAGVVISIVVVAWSFYPGYASQLCVIWHLHGKKGMVLTRVHMNNLCGKLRRPVCVDCTTILMFGFAMLVTP